MGWWCEIEVITYDNNVDTVLLLSSFKTEISLLVTRKGMMTISLTDRELMGMCRRLAPSS